MFEVRHRSQSGSLLARGGTARLVRRRAEGGSGLVVLVLLGVADMVKFSIRGKPVRGWRPQPPSAGLAGSFGFKWDIQKLSPEVWEEYQKRLAAGKVKEW